MAGDDDRGRIMENMSVLGARDPDDEPAANDPADVVDDGVEVVDSIGSAGSSDPGPA